MKAPCEWEFSNLLEILRFYAESYCLLAAHCLDVGLQVAISGSRDSDELATGVIRRLMERLAKMKDECEKDGLESTSDVISLALQRWQQYEDQRLLMVHCGQIITTLENELKRRVCFILPRSSQKLYENPTEKWEPILARFPDARGDIEEMNRCIAFNRYSAAVFHVLLAVEHGLVALGQFVGVKDKKPGWDATSKALTQILAVGRTPKAPRKIRKHFAFLELANRDMQSMKMAWRNKVSHAANQLTLMTSDFKPEVAEKIISASHGFMLLLATDGPLKQ